MIPKTLAVKITDKTYPIAYACLPWAAFAMKPAQEIIDKYYMVINIQTPTAIPIGRRALLFSNTYITLKEFEEQFYPTEYKDPNDRVDGEFFEVFRK